MSTIRDDAEQRAKSGDGLVAGLLAIIRDLEAEIERKNEALSEWESGKRTPRQEVWGYDG